MKRVLDNKYALTLSHSCLSIYLTYAIKECFSNQFLAKYFPILRVKHTHTQTGTLFHTLILSFSHSRARLLKLYAQHKYTHFHSSTKLSALHDIDTHEHTTDRA